MAFWSVTKRALKTWILYVELSNCKQHSFSIAQGCPFLARVMYWKIKRNNVSRLEWQTKWQSNNMQNGNFSWRTTQQEFWKMNDRSCKNRFFFIMLEKNCLFVRCRRWETGSTLSFPLLPGEPFLQMVEKLQLLISTKMIRAKIKWTSPSRHV